MSGERLSGVSFMPEYRVWVNMIQRCTNSNNPSFPDYGGRGIRICSRWLDSFDAFFADVGNRPTTDHSIERRDVNGHYEPGNCRWATAEEQANNTRRNVRVVYGGEELTITQLSRKVGMASPTLFSRLARGQTIEQATAVERPPRSRPEKCYDLDGEPRTLKEWAAISGTTYETLYSRIHERGMSLKDALAVPYTKKHRGKNKKRPDTFFLTPEVL